MFGEPLCFNGGSRALNSPLGDRRSGFSLIEIVVAMGILTFSLVGLLALFPVALQTAADSKSETRITQIAQSIFADIHASPLNAVVMVAGPAGTETERLENLDTFDLSITGTYYLAYRSDGQCVGVLTQSDYDNGVRGKGDFLVKLNSTPDIPATTPPLTTLTLSVESPAPAPADKRQKVLFVTKKGGL
ncbi:MAG: hypothetical protein HC904_07125 [Blastochloris sp.]|nr:hypothetical protein [Blastochloris sp.]